MDAIRNFIKNVDSFDIIIFFTFVCLLVYTLILSGVKYEDFTFINNFVDSCVSDWRSAVRSISSAVPWN